MKTIIVGSGMSVLDNENGSEIDEFDTVIRFKGFENNYQDFVDYAGSTMDVLVFNTNINTIRDMQEKCKNGFWKSCFGDTSDYFMTYTSKRSLRRGMRIMKGIVPYKVLTYPPIRKKVSRYVHQNDFGFKRIRRGLTSGVIVLMHVLMNKREFGEIYLHGFDSLVHDRNTLQHYYDPNPLKKHFGCHDTSKEGRVLHDLVDKGTIKVFE